MNGNRGRAALAVCLAAILLAATGPPSAAAPNYPIASGTVPSASGGLPWAYSARPARLHGIPGVCSSLLWAWSPSEPLGNGFPSCIYGKQRGHFSLYVSPCRGIAVAAASGSFGPNHIRAISVLAAKRVTRVKLLFGNGSSLARRGVRAPPEFFAVRPVRLAWLVDSATEELQRVIGYNHSGERIAKWRKGGGC